MTMAEEEKTEEKTEGKKGSGVVALVLNVLVAGAAVAAGFYTPYLIAGGSNAGNSNDNSQSTQQPAKDLQLEYVEFGEVTSNIDEPNLTRYLRVKISLEVAKDDFLAIQKLVEAKNMILKDWLNSFLASQNMASIRGMAGQNRLRREIKDHFNSTLFLDGVERIRGILFLEFNVQ
jgi:flagellar basal body-associated protein FliL